jgi:hypothetical protein
MDEKRDRNEETTPQAKRTGRDGLSPEEQPAEFNDDLRFNRFERPPDPGEEND